VSLTAGRTLSREKANAHAFQDSLGENFFEGYLVAEKGADFVCAAVD